MKFETNHPLTTHHPRTSSTEVYKAKSAFHTKGHKKYNYTDRRRFTIQKRFFLPYHMKRLYYDIVLDVFVTAYIDVAS